MEHAEDKAIIRVAPIWRASKSKAYRASIRESFSTLITFLQQNGLTTRVLLPDGAEIDEAFVMRRSDLSDEGYEFYRIIEQPWFNGIDRGASPSDASRLERALSKFRNQRLSAARS